jgi:2-polyprenyl-3-methyl-5-hydroxy-6-metoxy-1,4-benzoquinol methylase
MIHEDHNQAQREYYRTADQPTILPVESPYVMHHVEMLLSAGNLVNGQRILEVGAGMGRFSRILQARGLKVTACDISEDLIASLQRHSPEIPSYVGDVNSLAKHDNNKYDAVVGFFMLHHLPELSKAFCAMAAMLKPGGRLVFCEPNAWFFPFYLQILLTPRMRWSVDKGVKNMRRGILTPALQQSGFERIEYTHYGFLPPQLFNRNWGMRLDHGLDKIPLPARARAFQIITANHE